MVNSLINAEDSSPNKAAENNEEGEECSQYDESNYITEEEEGVSFEENEAEKDECSTPLQNSAVKSTSIVDGSSP